MPEFYVISVKHTLREHKYVTLWRPDDSGYCYRTARAGRYAPAVVRKHLGYYNTGADIAVPCRVVDAMTVDTTPADQLDGADGPALLNTRANWKTLLANVIEKPKNTPNPKFKGARRDRDEC
ncbi:MAG: hypothetical protein V4801_10275 [Burkholderia gladioli]